MNYFSWGRIKFSEAQECQLSEMSSKNHLVVGSRRSYGDSCFNSHHYVLDNLAHNRIISFDTAKGEITAQSGATIYQIRNKIVPAGYFFEVIPGTQNVTLGGAVANDVHGKNHERFGSFGNTIIEFLLIRKNEEFICSLNQNADLFHATIGGLGLTGYIKWVKIKLRKVKSSFLKTKNLSFKTIPEMISLFESEYEYKVAWLDLSDKSEEIRGILHVANHSNSGCLGFKETLTPKLPFGVFSPLISKTFSKIYNFFYFNKNRLLIYEHETDFTSFFFPLDRLKNWNEIYSNGFYQIQVQIPKKHILKINSLLERFKRTDEIPTLVILKKFGGGLSNHHQWVI